MPSPSIFSLLRQAIAHGKFDNSETRDMINFGIDALENADNDSVLDIEEHEDVDNAISSLQSHLAELLGSPITLSKDDDERKDGNEDEADVEDEIER